MGKQKVINFGSGNLEITLGPDGNFIIQNTSERSFTPPCPSCKFVGKEMRSVCLFAAIWNARRGAPVKLYGKYLPDVSDPRLLPCVASIEGIDYYHSLLEWYQNQKHKNKKGKN